ncbi:uncharacterized protein [Miscanthus floridulus]|uniref:uncharacterized protein isoform X5 n=1 Tax=Miscanthus floridulus TaxID=154761 RepID=UPI003457D038
MCRFHISLDVKRLCFCIFHMEAGCRKCYKNINGKVVARDLWLLIGQSTYCCCKSCAKDNEKDVAATGEAPRECWWCRVIM